MAGFAQVVGCDLVEGTWRDDVGFCDCPRVCVLAQLEYDFAVRVQHVVIRFHGLGVCVAHYHLRGPVRIPGVLHCWGRWHGLFGLVWESTV